MFAQIFLGIAFFIIGIEHLRTDKFYKNVKPRLNKQKYKQFKRYTALTQFTLGILFIMMGIIENLDLLNTSIFLTIYITLGAIILGLVLALNKIYLGSLLR